jgi:signal transduction histidine kinase
MFIFLLLLIVLYFLSKQKKLNQKLLLLEASLRENNRTLEIKIEKAVKQNDLQHQQLFQQSRLAQMGEMISMIAHQWRQPLSAISAASSSLELKAILNKVDSDTVIVLSKKISGYSQHLSKTIDDFRNFYKSNKDLVKVSYKNIIESALNIIRPSLEFDKIELKFEYGSEERLEMYDSEMMQVVLNLFKNSQDNFNEKNIKNKIIKIKTFDNTLSICDNGGGIEEKIIDNIFDPYFSTKDEKNGSGLGLYMSKIIVDEHHKGSLNVKNTDDGVCFEIVLDKITDKDLL